MATLIPFINFDDLQAVVPETLAEDDLKVAIALDSACQMVRDEINQTINLVRDDIEILDGNDREGLILREMPVIEVTDVMEDDETLIPDDDYIVPPISGIVWRVGCRWSKGRQNIRVTYDHGWAFLEEDLLDLSEPSADVDRVPSSLREVALSLATRILRLSAVSVSAAGVTGETIGSYSYTLDSGAAATDTQVTLTDFEKGTLARYKVGAYSL